MRLPRRKTRLQVEALEDYLFDQGLEVMLPAFDGADADAAALHQDNLLTCNAVLVYYGTAPKAWVDIKLRELLKAEAKKQGKAYGLYFEDISSGFAVTTRRSPQAFQVIPLVVYRVYVDGRSDELVRGVSIVGTPQAALNRIIATNDKQDVFNGICGAESGSIPVSAVAPAMLVSEIETQRQAQGTARPPILPPPNPTGAAGTTTGGKGGQE